jgi:three-Cys-motif partner protein
MVQVPYQWIDGAVLKEHSKKKHQVLRRYVSEYLHIRCSLPQQERFRFSVIDGFSGGGAYQGGESGSPLIFLESLLEQSETINTKRSAQGMRVVKFECLFIFNDVSKDAIDTLKHNISPLQVRCRHAENLNVSVEFMNKEFQFAYEDIKDLLKKSGISKNVFFNLDQCGNSLVPKSTIVDILKTYDSAEVLLNIGLQSMLTCLSRNNPERVAKILEPHGVDLRLIEDINSVASKQEWRAAIERLVFESYKNCSPYVSPFAINNPDGWFYWLLHFANNPKARQVYNDLLHDDPGVQGHCGRFGLNMFTYDPLNEVQDYLFAEDDRQRAREQLFDDIPRVVSDFGNAVNVADFIRSVSNETPAHSADLAQSMIDNPDLTIVTENGGERRSAKGIRSSDTIVLNAQRSFILMPPIK